MSSSLSCRHSFHFSVSYCCFSFKFCFKSCFFLMIKNNKKEKKPFTDLPDRECLDTSGSVNLDLDERRSSNNSFKRIFLWTNGMTGLIFSSKSKYTCDPSWPISFYKNKSWRKGRHNQLKIVTILNVSQHFFIYTILYTYIFAKETFLKHTYLSQKGFFLLKN